jgi:3-deoxy-7-phosphoheptulonate synthase
MSFKYLREISPPGEIQKTLPLSPKLVRLKKKRDREIRAVFTRESGKFLLIIGPCSAHDEEAVCDYVARLAKLQEEVREKILLIPRIYTHKPRTNGLGYMGMAHQPIPGKTPDILEGLKATRRMHLRALRESGLPAADEILYPGNYAYLEDLLSYVVVGARSVENQAHRLTCSGFDIPVGMKNPISGDLEVMLHSIQAAQSSHIFTYNRWEVRTSGNPLTHAVLRGAVDRNKRVLPNYEYQSLIRFAKLYRKRGLANPTIIVDTSHANSNKKFSEQPRIAKEVMHSRRRSSVLNGLVRGLMIESFLEEGSQPPPGVVYGKSITDPCLGWEDSKRLIRELAELV